MCRKYMHGSGLGPTSPKIKRFISLWLLFPVSLLLDVLVIYDFHFLDNDIFKTAELLESVSSFGQLPIRKFILTYHSKLIQNLLEDRKKFWSYEMFGETYGKFLRRKMVLATRLIQTMIFFGASVATLMFVSTLADDRKTVPLECWIPEFKHSTHVVLVMQFCSLCEIIYLVGAVDCLYVLTCVDIKIQFLLLQKKLKTIQVGVKPMEECLNELTICVKHHNLLLRSHKSLNRIFSEYFFVQYFVSVLAACVQLYILMYITASLEDIMKSIVYLSAVVFQVAIFFMPASDIEEEAEQFAVEIYNVNWECTSGTKFRKQLLFMLMKAQKPLYMLGGGMIHANRNEYIVLFRLAFSISTLLGGMNENGRTDK
ncbi:odorant receptor 7a isoform X1 [Tribolium castaneum]|uniref:Odorant receptor n=1 Tax=Tribolium castaneum TaxID=7070 RepID=D6WC89_TRICA|nr:PREDICTED: odorant receptor 7a isoform X1 [Tribolium castaneum]EEZ99175.2 odorant receptor 153 [Tribolium castaneum]|eukprot:XP_008190484.2 PREDICTED: odorant receptor 7a isoform X1 [Tribolium castaneum]